MWSNKSTLPSSTSQKRKTSKKRAAVKTAMFLSWKPWNLSSQTIDFGASPDCFTSAWLRISLPGKHLFLYFWRDPTPDLTVGRNSKQKKGHLGYTLLLFHGMAMWQVDLRLRPGSTAEYRGQSPRQAAFKNAQKRRLQCQYYFWNLPPKSTKYWHQMFIFYRAIYRYRYVFKSMDL